MKQKNKAIIIRVTADEKLAYKKLAVKRGVSLSDIIRELLDKECKK